MSGLALFALLACQKGPTVAVIGGGPAGLAAAWEAAQGGATVHLYEAQAKLGGSAVWSDAITADPTPGDLARWDAEAGGENAARRRLVERMRPDVIEGLAPCGTRFEPTRNPLDDGLALVRPTRGGRGLMADLEGCARKAGVTIHTGAAVTGVSRAGAGFALQVGDQKADAAVLILATGGFMADLDHVRAVAGLGADVPLLRGAPRHADGNGLRLGAALGGVEASPGSVLLYAHGTPAPGEPDRAVMVVDPRRGLILDQTGAAQPGLQGQRGDAGHALAALPGGKAWIVMDGLAFDRMPFFDFERGGMIPPIPLRSGAVTAPTVEALAAALAVAPDALVAARSSDRPDAAHPLGAQGPYWALPLVPTTAKSLTGLVVDLDGHVLDAQGAPVAGLFAAGELTGFGAPYDGHPIDSTMVSGAIITGRAAGRAALR